MSDKTSYFNGRVLFNGIAISYLFKISGSSTFIVGLIGTIVGIIFLLLFKNNNKLSKLLSSFIITFIVLTILINMGHSLYLKNTPIWVLTIIPCVCMLIISNSKTSALIKVSHILFIYSLFLFILEILGLYSSIELSNLLPLSDLNIKSIIWGFLVFAITSTTPIITLNDLSDKKSIIINYLISSLTINIIAFFAITVLGQKEVLLFRFPETVVLKRIEFLNFISSVDSFFNFAVIVDVLLTMAKGLKNIEELTSKTWKYVLLFIIALLTIWSCYNNWPLLLIYKYFPYILIILLIITIIPIKNRYKKVK